jgi:isoleucyl-tRNA synthetase
MLIVADAMLAPGDVPDATEEEFDSLAMPKLLARYGVKAWKLLGRAKGKALEGIRFRHPFYDRDSPVYLGDYVTLDQGTGVVHSSPAYGVEDFVSCRRAGLKDADILTPVMGDGKYVSSLPLFGGLSIWDANPKIVKTIQEKGALFAVDWKHLHSYMHCWRHKTPIILRATTQWFAAMDAVPPGARGVAAPGRAARHRADPVLSRLGPGAPGRHDRQPAGLDAIAPAAMGRADAVLPAPAKRARCTRARPSCSSRSRSVSNRAASKPGKASPQKSFWVLKVLPMKKARDTLDVWFDSGSTHFTVMQGSHPSQHAFPADLYLEGSDQHRGWFHSSLLISCMLNGVPPYKALLTYGFVIDMEGRKMSKSSGTGMSPQEITGKFGAEILRLWVASGDFSGERNISNEILTRVVESYRRIRNTLRFLLANTSDFDAGKQAVPIAEMVEIDRYALALAAKMQDEVMRDYESYQYHLVSQKLLAFCAEDLGAFYLDILKDRLYTCGADSKARRSAQTALWHVAQSLVKLMAPILSFTAEEAWQVMTAGKAASVFEETWLALPAHGLDETTLQAWESVRQLRELATKRSRKSANARNLARRCRPSLKYRRRAPPMRLWRASARICASCSSPRALRSANRRVRSPSTSSPVNTPNASAAGTTAPM